MPLTHDQDEREHELRVEQMSVGLEQARVNIEKMRTELRYESRRFAVQFVVAIAVSVGAGVALANYVNAHQPPVAPAPPPQIIYLQPGPPPAPPYAR